MGSKEEARRPRIALYSHDTMGLGHIRRNLLIAQILFCSSLHARILLITGTPQAAAFPLPYCVSCLTLPSLHKESSGGYRSQYQGITLRGLIDFRSMTIRSAIEEFDPDLLIVDKVPRGALRELDFTLQYLRRTRKTHCILGLRDVLDDPQIVRQEWQEDSIEDTIREHYDSIWVYGDPKIYDSVYEYQFPRDIAAKVMYTGYLDQRIRLCNVRHNEDAASSVLCMVGGGQDGARLVETFIRCKLPSEIRSIVLSGPFIPVTTQRRLNRYTAKNQGFKVFDFIPEPIPLLAGAARVIAMGGYNTMCEVLSFEKIALIVPRVVPRREQVIRAEQMQKRNFVDVLNWEDVTTEALMDWLRQEKQPPQIQGKVDMGGLDRIVQYVSKILLNQKLELQPMS